MEIRVKNEVIELVLVRIFDTNDNKAGLYVIDCKEFDSQGDIIYSGIVKRTDI